MELSNLTIGFIGAGNMAEALIRGLVASRTTKPRNVVVNDIHPERTDRLHLDLKVTVAKDNADLISRAHVIVLAVKPQNLTDLAPEIQGLATPDKLFISILAGVRTERIERILAHEGCPEPRVIRVMPNTPALVRAGASAIAPGSFVNDSEIKIAKELLDSVGLTEVVENSHMDAITGLIGTGPAYVFRLMEALVAAGVEQGLPRLRVERMVRQMVYGAALMARDSLYEPEDLRRQVTSPGGTTAAGMEVLEKGDFQRLMLDTVAAATRRSEELGKIDND